MHIFHQKIYDQMMDNLNRGIKMVYMPSGRRAGIATLNRELIKAIQNAKKNNQSKN